MSVRLAASVALVLLLSSCAGLDPNRDDALLLSKMPRYPECEAEMRAFIALAKLARQLGENWSVYEPALEALQEQIMDCVDDNYPDPVPI